MRPATELRVTGIDGAWLGATIRAKTDAEGEPVLHDEFCDSYWCEEDHGSDVCSGLASAARSQPRSNMKGRE
jgi:hypothetical protein